MTPEISQQPTSTTATAGRRRQGGAAWWLGQMRAQPLATVGAVLVLIWVLRRRG